MIRHISSLWPVPLRARGNSAQLASGLAPPAVEEGRFFVQDANTGWPALPGGVKRLRILQVLPKSTPHANDPPVGLANASPGKQVLGTVPVEADGSAWFRAPAKMALAFQALDESGQAIQTMRSVVYLQPGETQGCIGCHEERHTAPRQQPALALSRPPSVIDPGPEGSRPLNYARLVQPVLDRHCVRCHNPQRPDGKVVLTGEPQGHYTVSYNALAPLVSFSSWGGKPGDFRIVNSEPLSQPDFFGARGSHLGTLLRKGHEDVALPAANLNAWSPGWMPMPCFTAPLIPRPSPGAQGRVDRRSQSGVSLFGGTPAGRPKSLRRGLCSLSRAGSSM